MCGLKKKMMVIYESWCLDSGVFSLTDLVWLDRVKRRRRVGEGDLFGEWVNVNVICKLLI
ncbi:hypothetical protein HanRHA438_Chr15g0731561 [Helianthus annuus]|nr:hypothetical protein HanRHA438_Chr15g0731561 [Helianthus annuus]